MRGRERVLAPRRATMLSDATYLCPLLFLFPSSRCSSFPSFPYFPPFDFSFCHACLLQPSCAFHPLVFPIPCCIVNVSLTFSPVHPLFASCLCLGVSVVCFHPILLFSRNNRQSTYTPGSFRVLLAKFFFLLSFFFSNNRVREKCKQSRGCCENTRQGSMRVCLVAESKGETQRR